MRNALENATSVATNLGEQVSVTHAWFDDLPLVTLHARLPEGLADLSPSAAITLGKQLIDAAFSLGFTAESHDEVSPSVLTA